jgi:predicted 2-oxoglutarate/Fe(II)-dependent dioxygenase YbiX
VRALRGPGAQRHRAELTLRDPERAAPSTAELDLVEMLSPETCAAIVAAAERSTAWQDAPLYHAGGSTVNPAVRRAQLLHERDLEAELGAAWADVRARAAQVERAHGRALDVSELQVVRYRPGGFFYTHQDATASHTEWRKLSFVLYLNDDFEGGATCFSGPDAKVEPRTGYAAVFAPHRVHYADTVTQGEKYILLFWLGRHER